MKSLIEFTLLFIKYHFCYRRYIELNYIYLSSASQGCTIFLLFEKFISSYLFGFYQWLCSGAATAHEVQRAGLYGRQPKLDDIPR